MSEGLDFADARGRAVIIAGIPFAPTTDVHVLLKRRYMDETKREGGSSAGVSGESWYSQQAARAVNQVRFMICV